MEVCANQNEEGAGHDNAGGVPSSGVDAEGDEQMGEESDPDDGGEGRIPKIARAPREPTRRERELHPHDRPGGVDKN